MRKLSWTLGVIAALFAGTTVYFARALHLERASHAAVAAAPAEAAGAAAKTSARSTATSGELNTSREIATSRDPAASSKEVSPDFSYAVTRTMGNGPQLTPEQQKQIAIEQSRKFLAQLADPAGRARLLEQHKAMVQVGTEGLADYLRMDADEFARFLELRARQDLDRREQATRCMLDPKCRYRGASEDFEAAQQRDVASAFGPETFERYLFFTRSTNERRAVAELRGRLPDSARLSDAKAEELVRTWVEESERITADMKRVGYGIGTSDRMIYEVMDPDPDGARAAAAAEYNRRFRERASSVLTSEQFAIYSQWQKDALDQRRAFEEMRRAAN
jgi:hypothetical protein